MLRLTWFSFAEETRKRIEKIQEEKAKQKKEEEEKINRIIEEVRFNSLNQEVSRSLTFVELSCNTFKFELSKFRLTGI